MCERSQITDLNQLRVFAEVARTSSITAAARRLDKPKSTVSRDVARLEQSLGTVLLSRNGRRLVLTEAGELFAEHAGRILAGVEEATDAVAATVPVARGVVTVQATYWLGHALLVPHLASFMDRFPQMNVDLELKDFANLSTHDWDVQLTAGALADSSHVARRITAITLRLYASAGYVSRRGVPTKLGDLERHVIVDKHWTNGTSPWPGGAGTRPAAIKPRLVVNDMIAIAEAIREGAGIGWMPSFLAERTPQAEALVPVLPDLKPASMPVFAVFPRRRSASPKVRAFVDFLVEAFAE
ncbi:hypothetical protein GQ56_0123260 [Burkholderia paludis]|uniref:LysR family transcriptional regulator n=1 Tax=Burkholderia paludis TaxID=1506587 RepID=UPI0004DB4C82|nr:LysR family transcriptional regulator [Burkholderia paludis]KFG94945.1 hypothetical protein GQ56_0123260 [Burkholderia paludis]